MENKEFSLSRGNTLGRSLAVSVLALATYLASAKPADAQAVAATPAAAGGLEEVVVTGSHIVSSGFTAPTPVTVVGQERLEQRGITNVGEALNELPSFRAIITPATQQAVGGNVGARVLDLRGLGSTRTLVLVDGKRFVPSTTTGTVDVNLIPSALVKRAEVVTGGASAAYGSDAVAGVVNLILDKNLEGFRASLQHGSSSRGDDEDTTASLAFGGAMGNSGHFVLGVENDKAHGMGDCYVRDWCPREQGAPSDAGWNGLPATIRMGPLAPGNLNQDGLINTTSGPLRGITFNRDGTTRNYQYGTIYGTNLSPLFTLGGEGTYENGYLQGILLKPPVERTTVYAHLDHAFSDRVRGNLDLSFGKVDGTVIGSEARASNFAITRDNAYLPASVVGIMTANNINSFTLGRVFGDLGGAVDEASNKTYRAVASLAGDLSGSWNWDAYYQYGRNKFSQAYTGNVVITRMKNAIDAVNSGGKVVCRINADASASNDDPNCVPFNVFGRANSSAEARAYVAPSGYQTADTTQHVVAANLHGELFSLPGGPVAVATGVEYRSDDMVGTADALSTTNQFWSFNGKAINGKIDVTEAYAEAVAPLLKNVTGVRSLELNGAVRQTSYDRSSPGLASSSASATTWKTGLVYEPIEQIRLRATRSRDIRAPNLTEMYGPVTAGRVTVVDPVVGAPPNPAGQIISLTGANPLLKPEKADTWTVGVVLAPEWEFARSLRLSIDYYSISVQGAIEKLGPQTVINRCASGATEYCPFVSRDGTNMLTQVQDVLQNVNRLVNRGIDFEASLRSDFGSAGSIDYRLLATNYLELSTRDSVGVTDRAGQTGYRPGTTTGVPDWIVDGSVNWTRDQLSFGAHMRLIPSGKFDALLVGPEDKGYNPALSNSVNSNRVDSRVYFDLNASVRLPQGVEVFGVINNVFDRNPPLAASAQGGTNQVYFDPVGRYYKLGLRLKM